MGIGGGSEGKEKSSVVTDCMMKSNMLHLDVGELPVAQSLNNLVMELSLHPRSLLQNTTRLRSPWVWARRHSFACCKDARARTCEFVSSGPSSDT